MRRILALILLLAPAAQAWEFRATPVCTLSHAENGAEVTVTWDPRLPEPYAIALSAPEAWTASPVFALRFDGPRGMTLTTDRHRLSADSRTLTVTDTGFGNVLDGLEFNKLAIGLTGGRALAFGLEDAAEPVQDFRACAVVAGS